MKNKIMQFIIRWGYSLVLVFASVMYGLQILRYPMILQTYSVYQHINLAFSSEFVGLWFIVVGILEFISVLIRNRRLKQFSLTFLAFSWMFLGMSFFLSSPPNTIWIFTITKVLLVLVISIRSRGVNDDD